MASMEERVSNPGFPPPRFFNSTADDTSPKMEDFINRAKSVIDAAIYLRKSQIDIVNNLNLEFDTIHKKIKEQFDIDQGKENIKDPKARDRYIKKTCKKFNHYLNHFIFAKLLGHVTIPGETELETSRRLRQAENNYLSEQQCDKRPAPLHHIIEFPENDGTPSSKHFSKQIRLEPNVQNCYQRNGGVSNLRKQTAGHIDESGNEVTDIEFYPHTSLVPTQEKDDALKRLAKTAENVEELLQILAEEQFLLEAAQQPKPINTTQSVDLDVCANSYSSDKPLKISLTEIRLLSVLHRQLAFLDNEQHQYQQTLEAYLAFSIYDGKSFSVTVRCPDGKERSINVTADISFVDFGVNWASFYAPNDPLKDWINVRGINQLYDNFLNHLDECYKNDVLFNARKQSLITASDTYTQTVIEGRKKLEEAYQKLHEKLIKYNNNKNEEKRKACQQQLQEIEQAIKQQHKLEGELLNIRKSWWEENRTAIRALIDNKDLQDFDGGQKNLYQLWQDFADVQDLFYSRKYNTPDYNYRLQALLVDLNYKMGRKVGFGCNDAKDRAGCLSNAVEAHVASRHRNNGKNLCFINEKENGKFNFIWNFFHKFSTSLPGTEKGSVPGARGYQLYARDVPGLDLVNSELAKLGKEIYKVPLVYRIKHNTVKAIRWLKGCVQKPEVGPVISLVEQPQAEQSSAIETTKPKALRTLLTSLLTVLALLVSVNPALATNVKKDDLFNSSRESSSFQERKSDSSVALMEERKLNGGQRSRQRPKDSDVPLVPVNSRSSVRTVNDPKNKDEQDIDDTSNDRKEANASTKEFLKRNTQAISGVSNKKEYYMKVGSPERQRPITAFLREEESLSASTLRRS